MKNLFVLFALTLPLVLVSCDKDKDKDNERTFSIIGTWIPDKVDSDVVIEKSEFTELLKSILTDEIDVDVMDKYTFREDQTMTIESGRVNEEGEEEEEEEKEKEGHYTISNGSLVMTIGNDVIMATVITPDENTLVMTLDMLQTIDEEDEDEIEKFFGKLIKVDLLITYKKEG